MITVKVVSESSGKSVKGARVAVSDERFFSQGVSKGQYTDANGEAHFDMEPHRGKVFVNGSTKHEGHLSGRIVVYV